MLWTGSRGAEGEVDGGMSRRAFLASGTAFLAAPLAAEAQKGRTYRVGVLVVGYPEELRQALRALGYVEGRNLAFEVRETDRRHLSGGRCSARNAHPRRSQS